jgi:hypothetical protein
MSTMSSKFEVFDGVISSDLQAKIVAFAKSCEIGEDFDLACDLIYIWTVNSEIVAVIAFKRVLFSDGRMIPRIEHVIFDKNHDSHRAVHDGYRFLLTAFQNVKEIGFSQVFAYITERPKMRELAVKFGFRPYHSDSKGDYLVKDL